MEFYFVEGDRNPIMASVETPIITDNLVVSKAAFNLLMKAMKELSSQIVTGARDSFMDWLNKEFYDLHPADARFVVDTLIGNGMKEWIWDFTLYRFCSKKYEMAALTDLDDPFEELESLERELANHPELVDKIETLKKYAAENKVSLEDTHVSS